MNRDRERQPTPGEPRRHQNELSTTGRAAEPGPPPMGQTSTPPMGQTSTPPMGQTSTPPMGQTSTPPQAQQPSGAQPSMPPQQSGTEITGGKPTAAVPMIDVVESPDEVVVHVDLPGFDEDQIDIHADANNIYVTADRSEDPVYDADEGESALLIERPERMERRISLPSHIDPEEAEASNEDGVCRIAVQKEEQERRHEIGFQ